MLEYIFNSSKDRENVTASNIMKHL